MSRTSRTNAIVGLSSGLVGPVLGPLLAVALLLSVCAVPALAQEHAPRPERPERTERGARTEQPADPQGVLRLLPADATSDKSITIAGRTLAYTATAGTLSLYDQNGERTAAVFYTAYVLKDSANPSATPRNISADAARNTAANDNTARPDRSSRPVTFAFNGGPGAASAYLHLGLAGPRIVEFGPRGNDGAAAKLVDNPDTWLPFTDLVFIDPIGAGWSRTAKPDAAASFWGVRRDAETLAKVIALYVAHNGRSASPKFLLGESYGGFRAAKVATRAQGPAGHRHRRHRDGVADARRRPAMGRHRERARRRAAPALARRRRARPHQDATRPTRWPRSSALRCTTISPRSPGRRRRAKPRLRSTAASPP